MAAEESSVDVLPVVDPAAEEIVENSAAIEPEVPMKKKVSKEAKPKKVSAPKTPKVPSAHPTYLEMIKDAIVALKERTGSSQYAISKFIESKHKSHLPPHFKKILLLQIKKLVAGKKLVQVKHSFKLPPTKATIKKPTAVANSKPAPAKPKTSVKPNVVTKSKAGTKSKLLSKAKGDTKSKSTIKTKSVVKPKPSAKPKLGKKSKTSTTKKVSAVKPATPKKPKSVKSTKSPAKKARKTNN